MNDLNTAARYATALYEVAAENEELEKVLQDMSFMEKLMSCAG